MADATNEYGLVMTSSPGPQPAVIAATCRPAVPLETATACLVPTNDAKSCSNRVNIANMAVAREGGKALMAVSFDEAPPRDICAQLAADGEFDVACVVDLG